MRYPSGTPVNCVDSSGGSPGGSSGNLQTNNGAGGFGAYAGSSCSAGQAATSVNASGTLTCSAYGTGTVTSVATDSSLTGGPITTTGTLALGKFYKAMGAVTAELNFGGI